MLLACSLLVYFSMHLTDYAPFRTKEVSNILCETCFNRCRYITLYNTLPGCQMQILTHWYINECCARGCQCHWLSAALEANYHCYGESTFPPIPSSSLPSPLSLLSLPLLLPSPFLHPSPSPRSRSFLFQHSKLPQRRLGQSPPPESILVHFSLKI